MSVRQPTLTILEQSVHRFLEDKGTVEPGSTNLWPEDLCHASQRHSLTTIDGLRSCIDDIQTLKAVRKALKLILENLNDVIKDNCKAILPASREIGITALPDDALHHILVQLHASYGDPFEGSRSIIRDLSLVSRRFRELVLAFADVWAHLDLTLLSTTSLELLLSRSKEKPLSVQFIYNASAEKTVLQALTTCDRWTTLYANFSRSNIASLSKLPPLSFPSAKLLIIHWPHTIRIRKFPTWTFPQARILHLSGDLPLPGQVCCHSLHWFCYTSDETPIVEADFFLARLAGFLEPTLTSLRTLIIDLKDFEDFDALGGEVQVELPRVKDFIISNWRGGKEENFHDPDDSSDENDEVFVRNLDFARLIGAIWTPSAVSVAVSIAFEDPFHLRSWISLAFPRAKEMRRLYQLTFRILNLTDDLDYAFPIDELFGHFLNLMLLDLDIRCGVINYTHNADMMDSLAKLQGLRIKFDGEDDVQFYGALLSMSKNGVHPVEIKINSPRPFNSEPFREMFPGADVSTGHLCELEGRPLILELPSGLPT